MKKRAPLRIIPLGGLGEIGMNLMVLECGEDILLIDCGVLFPDLYWMGLDLVLPDFSYLIENQKRIRGLVVTHGHEDHIGGIPFLLRQVKIPMVYCSRFAARLIEDKCSEHGTLKDLLIYKVAAGNSYDVGSFNVEFIHVTHSTLETFALAITTPHGIVVHSGDFKFDETPYQGPPSNKKRLKEIGKMKPLLLLSDSTNSERCGHSASEQSISDDLDRHIAGTQGAVIVALFASNIHRVHQLVDLAEKNNRNVFLSGRSMERYVQIAIDEGFLPIKLSLLRPIEEIERYNRNEILVLSTGSQGEARSSLLRLAKNENRWFKIQSQDAVILSSRNIPGNERAISYVINQLYKLGATVHYEDMTHVHVSGHAYQSEQIDLIKMISPEFFIPVHGEYRHLVIHAKTARENGVDFDKASVIENGQIWEYDGEKGSIKAQETVQTGRHWVFRSYSGPMGDEAIIDRRFAARSGVVVVTCQVEKRGTRLLQSPDVTLRGFFCSPQTAKQIKTTAEKVCEEAFENWFSENPEGQTREQAVAAAARRTVKRALDSRPLVVVNFISPATT